ERLAGRLRPLGRFPRGLEDLARAVEDRARVGTGPSLRDRPVERFLDEAVPFADIVRDVADDEGARHVGVDAGAVVAREDVDDERRPRPDRTRAHVVPDGAL